MLQIRIAKNLSEEDFWESRLKIESLYMCKLNILKCKNDQKKKNLKPEFYNLIAQNAAKKDSKNKITK